MRQYHLFKFLVSGLLTVGTAGVVAADVKDFVLTAPENATVKLSKKKSQTHYVAFQDFEPSSRDVRDGKQFLTYSIDASGQYSYRVSRTGALTHAGMFNSGSQDAIEITEENLARYTNRYFNHDVWGNGTNYSDIFLNINKRGLLRLKAGDSFQIVNIRTWQLTNSSTANYFIEPDYSWTVLNTDFKPDNSVLEVDGKGVLTARKAGTAIVQVRYDAINLGAMGGSMWSELWAENTGTFVVTVDADETKAPADNIRLSYKPDYDLDSEHDILYYMADEEGYRLTFTPAEGAEVAVANPLVDTKGNNVDYPDGFSSDSVTVNPDGSVTVLLTYGRNIIRTADGDGNANYQVLSAKPVEMALATPREDGLVLPGDAVKMQFKGLYHVAGKLAGIYNSNCYVQFEGKANGDQPLGNGQYDFAGNALSQTYLVQVPPEAEGDITVSGGCLKPLGYGSAPGGHRAINYETGKDPNFNAGIASGQFGSIPDQTISITPIRAGLRLKATVALGSRMTPVSPEAVAKTFGEGICWKSTDESIVKVSDAGEVISRKPGVASVIAYSSSARAAEEDLIVCDITVPENPDYIPLESIRFRQGESMKFTVNRSWGNWGNIGGSPISVVFTPENATNKNVTFTSGNTDILTVKKSGSSCQLFWVGDGPAGTTTVTAESEDGAHIATIEVEVVSSPMGMTLDPQELSLNVGDTYCLEAVTRPNPVTNPIYWSSSDSETVSVDDQGTVTARAVGSATITAKCSSLTRTCLVTVSDTSVGVETVNAEDARFYPNPCDGVLYVDTAEAVEFEVFALDGSPVHGSRLEAGNNMVDLSGIPTGLYVVRVGNQTSKLIRR